MDKRPPARGPCLAVMSWCRQALAAETAGPGCLGKLSAISGSGTAMGAKPTNDVQEQEYPPSLQKWSQGPNMLFLNTVNIGLQFISPFQRLSQKAHRVDKHLRLGDLGNGSAKAHEASCLHQPTTSLSGEVHFSATWRPFPTRLIECQLAFPSKSSIPPPP